MNDSSAKSTRDVHSMLKVGSIILGLGFLATAGGSIWTILSPIDGGVNFGAGALYEGGMLLGIVGLVLTISGLFTARKATKED